MAARDTQAARVTSRSAPHLAHTVCASPYGRGEAGAAWRAPPRSGSRWSVCGKRGTSLPAAAAVRIAPAVRRFQRCGGRRRPRRAQGDRCPTAGCLHTATGGAHVSASRCTPNKGGTAHTCQTHECTQYTQSTQKKTVKDRRTLYHTHTHLGGRRCHRTHRRTAGAAQRQRPRGTCLTAHAHAQGCYQKQTTSRWES